MKKIFSFVLCFALMLFCFGAGGCKVDYKIDYATFNESENASITRVLLDFCLASISVEVSDTAEKLTVIYPLIKELDGSAVTEVSVESSDDSLFIKDKILWHKSLKLWKDMPEVSVVLPQDRVYDLEISVDNGEVEIFGKDLSASTVSIEADNGVINVENTVNCSGKIGLQVDNGEIVIERFTAQAITASADNGKMTCKDGSVDTDVDFEIDNGEVVISGELAAYSIVIDVDNGEIDAKNCVINAKKLSFSTDNGEIKATLYGGREDYTVSMDCDIGETNISNGGNGERTLGVSVNIGDIDIYFTE